MKKFFHVIVITTICLLNQISVFAQDPTVQATNTTITSRTQSTLSVSWTRGNGARVIVVARPSGNIINYPIDGANSYSANSTYGSGAHLGNGNYVVYNGTGTSVTVSGLNASTQYTFAAYEYNNLFLITTTNYYYNTSYLSGNVESAYTLCTEPTTNVTNLNFTPSYTSCNVSWTGGNGAFSMITIEDVSDGYNYAAPVDGTSYSANVNYGSGSMLATSNYVCYQGGGTFFNALSLLPARTYRVRAFEYCGSSTGNTYNYRITSYPYDDFTTLNNPPTLNSISNQTVCQNSGASSISLSGISDGSSLESQNVTLTATSSNQTLIPNSNISISYANPNTTGTLTFTPATGQFGTTTITVTANDGFSSTNTFSRSFTITVNPIPGLPGNVTGDTYVCKNGSNYTYTVSSASNATGYNWTFPTGTVIVSGSGTNSITVNYPASITATSGVISVYATNNFGCGNGSVRLKTIFFDQIPVVADAGADVTICNGTYQLQGNDPGIGNSLWTVTNGTASLIDQFDPNTNVTGIASGNSVTLTYTTNSHYGVCPSSADQVVVTYDPSALQCQIFSDFYSSTTSPCVGDVVNFTENSTGATTWSWNFGPNAVPTISNLQNPTVVFNNSGPQTITLTVSGPNGSDSETKSNYITVNSTPAAASAISGLATLCAGTTQVNYSVGSISGATNYLWTLPSGANINSGAGTSAITVNFDTLSASGLLSVQGENACGTGIASSLSVTINPLPANAGTITGSASVCQGETGVSFSVPSIQNASNYNWTVPSGATIVANNGDNILVDFSSIATSGIVGVSGSNSCGSGFSTQLNIAVDPLPGSADPITGIVNITNCPASNGITYSITAVDNATNYVWTLPSGASIVNGNGTENITVDYAYGASSGNIEVYGENSCGTGASNNLSISVSPELTQDLCLVTVDETSSHNVVVWEKPLVQDIDSFLVYREVAGLGFVQIAAVAYDSLSQYIDNATGIDPNLTQYRYAVSVKDTCGNTGPVSTYHQTIYQFPPVINGNDIVLDWEDYIGITSGSFYYRIMRDTAGNNQWEVIDSVPSGITAYTDINGMNEGSVIGYYIEIAVLDICEATRAINHNSTRSNRSQNLNGNLNSITESNVLPVSIYPNPGDGLFILEMGVADQYSVEAFDLNGKLILSKSVSTSRAELDLKGQENGVYHIRITGKGGMADKRVIISR